MLVELRVVFLLAGVAGVWLGGLAGLWAIALPRVRHRPGGRRCAEPGSRVATSRREGAAGPLLAFDRGAGGSSREVSAVRVHRPTGSLLVAGKRVFPIVLSNPPPVGRKAPSGRYGLAEVAAGGVSFLRTGRPDWNGEFAADQIAAERERFDAAAAHGLRCWCWLGSLANLPAKAGSLQEELLVEVVKGLRDHPGLGVWKGVDEPANPNRPARIPAAGLVRAYRKLRLVDPDHPVVVTQAPRGTVAQLTPYRPSFDISGADVYPVSYPPGKHVGGANRDLSVVGDVTSKMVRAAAPKPGTRPEPAALFAPKIV